MTKKKPTQSDMHKVKKIIKAASAKSASIEQKKYAMQKVREINVLSPEELSKKMTI